MRSLIQAPTLPTFANGLTAQDFKRATWSQFAGEAGAYVAESVCGRFEAVAEPLQGGWRFWIVRTDDGETLQEASCAS